MAQATQESDRRAPAIVLMGVAGSGKTSVGEALSARLAMPFRDGDEFHPRANVEKMSSGVPLTDEDRWPWLDAIGAAIGAAGDDGIIVACSALRRIYRRRLVAAAGRPIVFVHLDGPRALLERRLGGRKGHFMPKSLLDSQLATLEPPGPGETAVTVPVEPPIEAVVDAVVAALPGIAVTGA
ncbi:MAG: gluconokinase [Bauldia sp.]|nr:gluconokinase [Bauldia sp.]